MKERRFELITNPEPAKTLLELREESRICEQQGRSESPKEWFHNIEEKIHTDISQYYTQLTQHVDTSLVEHQPYIEDIIHYRYPCLEDLCEKIPVILAKVEEVQKKVPSFQSLFFHSAFAHLDLLAKKALQKENVSGTVQTTEHYREQFTIGAFPFFTFQALYKKFIYSAREEEQHYFAPLIRHARSNIRMYLIEHCNMQGLSPDKAQELIQKKSSVALPFYFTMKNIDVIGLPPEVMGSTDTEKSIVINLDSPELCLDGQMNEGVLLEVFVHEIIHSITERSVRGYGLNYPKLLQKHGEKASPFSP